MLAQVTTLSYWKSEHDAETCEDAYGMDATRGLFVVADGAGTTLFSDAWANFLIQHFLHVPLLSSEPFEVEWWVRLAQKQFKNEFAGLTHMSWNAQQKAQTQGSYSTLATLRVSASDATHAEVQLLVFGDSCVFVSKAYSEHIWSFPLKYAGEFECAPICIPSKQGAFNRYFHQCQTATLDLAPADVVVIATDAVSKWIISAGGGRYSDQKRAFQEVTRQTTDSWSNFIHECRVKKEMIDDDSTTVIIALHPDTSANTPLGMTTEHSQQGREDRKQEFLQALEEQNKERTAICFGDGRDLLAEGVQVPHDDILLARKVADAQHEVLLMLRQEINNPNVVAILTPVWQKHAHLLYHEPCSENIRKTLTRLGVPIEPIEPVAPSVIQESTETTSQPSLDDLGMLYTRVYDVMAIQRSLQSDGQKENA